jgi:ankyrin repeat protein
MLAAYHGHAPLVKLLIQHGADPNCLNDRGQSPLAGAVFKGEGEVIEVRLRALCRKAGVKDADIRRLY